MGEGARPGSLWKAWSACHSPPPCLALTSVLITALLPGPPRCLFLNHLGQGLGGMGGSFLRLPAPTTLPPRGLSPLSSIALSHSSLLRSNVTFPMTSLILSTLPPPPPCTLPASLLPLVINRISPKKRCALVLSHSTWLVTRFTLQR